MTRGQAGACAAPPTPGLAASPGHLVRWVWQGPGWPQEPLLAPSPRYRNPPAVVTRQPGKPSPPGRVEPGGQQGSFSQWSEARAGGELIPEPAAQTGPQATLPHQCWAAAWWGGALPYLPLPGPVPSYGLQLQSRGKCSMAERPQVSAPLARRWGGGPQHKPSPGTSLCPPPPPSVFFQPQLSSGTHPGQGPASPSMHPRTLPPSKAPAWTEALSSLSRTPMLAALSPRLQEQPELGTLTSRA
ncbi:unnamed protein product [Lepidochelys olivacea]